MAGEDGDTITELRPGGGLGGETTTFDLRSMELPHQQANVGGIPRGPPGPASEASTLATALASEINSVMHGPKDAFLRSVTFYKDRPEDNVDNWSLTLLDPPSRPARRFGRGRKPARLIVGSVGGVVTLSSIREGDDLKSINGRKIGPSYNADRAMLLMDECLEEEGFLSIAVGNDEGEDILIQVTVIKPCPHMKYEEMGMIVWKWGVLCIKEIAKDSIFKHTVLKEADHIISINDIVCEKMTPEDFAHVLSELPKEVHILIRRGRQRWSGKFG